MTTYLTERSVHNHALALTEEPTAPAPTPGNCNVSPRLTPPICMETPHPNAYTTCKLHETAATLACGQSKTLWRRILGVQGSSNPAAKWPFFRSLPRGYHAGSARRCNRGSKRETCSGGRRPRVEASVEAPVEAQIEPRPKLAVLAGLTFGLVAGAISVRSTGGARFDGLLMFAAAIAGIAVALLSIRLLLNSSPGTSASAAQAPVANTGPARDLLNDSLQDMLDSTGPAVVAIGVDGSLTYLNPAAERLLGYHSQELKEAWSTVEILAPGESARLVAEMEKLCGIPRTNEPTPAGRMVAYMICARSLPPSQVPSFDAQLRHKDGSLLPVMLHISALRDSAGACTGLVAVALDQSATVRQEHGPCASPRNVIRDLFENSSEMIATLSPAGKFLYANPAWKRCFGKDTASLLELDSFDELFAPSRTVRGGVRSSAALWMANRWIVPRCATTPPTADFWNWN